LKRIVLLVTALTLLPAGIGEAGEKNQRPGVAISSIEKAHPERPRSNEYLITVGSVDPDGVMSELAIDLGDGVVVWMLLACDPETTQPGDSVTQEITWSYAPGEYLVRAWGYSTSECFSGPFQQSRPDSELLIVPSHLRRNPD
jgi:hypothetical protein